MQPLPVSITTPVSFQKSPHLPRPSFCKKRKLPTILDEITSEDSELKHFYPQANSTKYPFNDQCLFQCPLLLSTTSTSSRENKEGRNPFLHFTPIVSFQNELKDYNYQISSQLTTVPNHQQFFDRQLSEKDSLKNDSHINDSETSKKTLDDKSSHFAPLTALLFETESAIHSDTDIHDRDLKVVSSSASYQFLSNALRTISSPKDEFLHWTILKKREDFIKIIYFHQFFLTSSITL